MVSFKYLFTSAKADGGDSTLVKPSDWNAEHHVTTAADGVVLGVPAGAGPGAVQELPMASMFPSGFVSTFAGSVAPSGWLICDGSLHNRADLPALFTAIGTAYNIGGESSTQFRIPDCRGRVIAGVDGGAGRLGSYINAILGAAGGQEYESASVAVGQWVGGGGFAGSTNGAQSVNYNGLSDNPDNGGTAVTGGGGGAANTFHHHGVHISVMTGGEPLNLASFGASGFTGNASNIQPMIVMNMMVKT